MKLLNFHSFHIVDLSPWPLINSFNIMNLLLLSVLNMKFSSFNNLLLFFLSFLLLFMSMFLWWRDILRESALQGHHTFSVFSLMKISMILFILSEIMFFFSFFWAYFHFSLAPEFEISGNWPPLGISMINPYHMPLLNTVILLSSGATVTWSHYSVLKGCYYSSYLSLVLTVLLGILFTFLQFKEYSWTEFSLNDSVFGSIFFMATGFHGLHVIIGTLFLFVNVLRMHKSEMNKNHHFSLEAASWYWHFVDVVWIYLYIFVYWWFFV